MTCSAKSLRSSTIFVFGLLVLGRALADQDALTAGAATDSLDDVIVTAQRRSENIQRVPISITAISGDTLERARIGVPADLVGLTPNLAVQTVVGDNVPIFTLRGVSLNDYSYNQQAPIALYINEVYKGNPALFGISLYDIDRVEVLKGPQGTLYGKNTTGGAINFITKQPQLGSEEGYLQAGIGNYQRFDSEGAFNVPLTDNVAARFAYSTARATGWFKSVSPGIENKNGIQNFSVRAAVKFVATDSLQFTLSGQYSYSNPTDYGFDGRIVSGPGIGGPVYTSFNYLEPNGTVVSVPSNVPPDPRTGLGPRQLSSTVPLHRNDKARSLALTSTWDATNQLKLISITSLDRGTLFDPEDSAGSKNRAVLSFYYVEAQQIGEDLRLASNFSGPFNFTVGAYYGRETLFNSNALPVYLDTDYNQNGVLNYLDCKNSLAASKLNPAITVVGCVNQNGFNQTKDSYAAYVDSTYKLADPLTLHFGLRETHDYGRQYNFKSIAEGAGPAGGINIGAPQIPVASLIPGGPDLNATLSQSFKINKLTGRLGIDYDLTPDVMAYASFNRGYRGAGFNAQAFFQPSEFNSAPPETINAYELGLKSQLFEHRLTANGSVFYYDYRNQQFLNIDPITAAQTLNSVPKSKIQGAELELSGRATPDLHLNVGVGFVDARVVKGSFSGIPIDGFRLVAAPRWTGTVGMDWRALHGGFGEVNVHLDGSYTSSQYFGVLNTPAVYWGGFGLLNANIAYVTPNGNTQFSVWGKNLTDRLYATFIADLQAGFGEINTEWGPPLTYGIEVRHKF